MVFRQTVAMLGVVLTGCAAAAAAEGLAAETSYETIRNVVYAEREDRSLRADVYRPAGDGPFPAVLCVHGGAWAMGHKGQMAGVARRLADAGYVAISINYRLAPKHKFPAQIDDCRQALLWTRKNAQRFGIDPDRLGAWGYSAGGHLVALLGAGGKGLKAVVAGGAPCDFRDAPLDSPRLAFWLGGPRRKLPKVYEAASPASFVSPDDPPMFFYHGRRDEVVRVAHPKEMASALTKAGVKAEVLVIPEVGHLKACFHPDALSKGIDFLDKHLSAKPAK